jgi:hypothetical protein
MKFVFWIGPVWPGIIAPAVPKDWTILTFDDRVAGGNGSEAYKNWALSLGADPLSRLAPSARQILVAGFSRAHGAIEVLLGRAAAARDPRITALLALDSYYSALGVTQPKPGFLGWCELAAERNLPVVFTTSSGGLATHQSASDSIKPLAQALMLTETTLAIPNLPTPVNTLGRGSILWLDYQNRVRHEDHALKLAPPLLATGVPFRPFVDKPIAPPPAAHAARLPSSPVPQMSSPSSPQTSSSSSSPALGVAVGLFAVAGLGAVTYSLMRLLPKDKRKALPEKGEERAVGT